MGTNWYPPFPETFPSNLSFAIDGEDVGSLEQYRNADRKQSRTPFNAVIE